MLQCDGKQPPQLYKYVVLLNYSSLSHGTLGPQSHHGEWWDLRVSMSLHFVEAKTNCNGWPDMPFKDSLAVTSLLSRSVNNVIYLLRI